MSNTTLRKPACALALLLFCLAFGLGPAFGQSTTQGAIGGVVKDPQGAIVQNANVAVKNEETNKAMSGTTDSEGRFRIPQLDPGNYTVTVNATGFAAFTQQKVVVEVGRITPLDVNLSVGGATETVQVTGEAPVINTQQQDVSTNINQTSINELPTNGQRWSNYALLTPGSTPDGTFGLISFRGVSGLLNNNTVDGGDNNQAFFSEERGRTRINYTISQSSIREFQVNTSDYSAEYGRAAGGVVNAVTKSGTNEFHGQAFLYYRNNRFGARNPLATISSFNPATGQIAILPLKPTDVRKQFGGNIGGRIIKDKLFFFFDYDGLRRNFPGDAIFTRSNYLTTVNACTSATAAGCSATLFSQSLKNPSRHLTDAQINSVLTFLTNETGEVPRTGSQNIFLPKIDWNVNSKNTFTASYNRLRWVSPNGIQTQPTNNFARSSFGNDFVNIDSLNLRLTTTIKPTLLNEFRFQYGRDNEFEFSTPPLPGEPTTSLNGRSPDVFLTNGIEFGVPTFLERPAFPDEKRWQFADTMTLTHGTHTFKWGVDFNHVNDLQDNLRIEYGSYSYSNINDFIIDYLNFQSPISIPCSTSTRTAGRCYTSNYQQAFGPTRFSFRTNDYNLFFQDDYRVTPRLTLNLGLRYEYEQMPKPFLGNPLLPQTNQMPNDKNNFGPRVGFAYALTSDNKTSFRGGYGLYYGRIINSTILNALINTGNPGGQITSSVSQASGPIFPNILSSAPAGTAAVQYFRIGYQAPMIHEADLVIERQIARNTVVSGSFLFSFGKHLPYFVDTNLNPATSTRTYAIADGPFAGQSYIVPYFSGARPNPNFGAITEIRDTVDSKYFGFVVQANRRLTDGLQFQTSYTISSARDNGQTSTTFTTTNLPFNAFDQSGEWGPSTFDVRHKFVTSVVYAPKLFSDGDSKVGRTIFNGWSIAPIFALYTGEPVTAVQSGSAGTTGAAGFGSNQAGGVNGSGGATRFALTGRDAFRMPKIVNTDLRISRRFHIKESSNIEVLAEGFNIFNRTQVTVVNTTIYTNNATTNTLTFNPAFLSTTAAGGTLWRERQIQFAVRFEF
ncbi:MAG TPA: TonB-dependent receptor [Pyrinomonadaceae bacterium]|nr:TonB-dependent receptor [Pyrinomonadaceae bacterium]